MKVGQLGSLSGKIIIAKVHSKLAVEIKYGNVLGPNGSAKKGDSNTVALAKNASATIVKVSPKIRSDTISSHQVSWKVLVPRP